MGMLVTVAMMTSYHNTMMIYDCKQLINLQSLPPLFFIMKCRSITSFPNSLAVRLSFIWLTYHSTEPPLFSWTSYQLLIQLHLYPLKGNLISYHHRLAKQEETKSIMGCRTVVMQRYAYTVWPTQLIACTIFIIIEVMLSGAIDQSDCALTTYERDRCIMHGMWWMKAIIPPLIPYHTSPHRLLPSVESNGFQWIHTAIVHHFMSSCYRREEEDDDDPVLLWGGLEEREDAAPLVPPQSICLPVIYDIASW